MRLHYDELKKRLMLNIVNLLKNQVQNVKEYLMFHPIDKLKLPGKPQYLESPNFYLL